MPFYAQSKPLFAIAFCFGKLQLFLAVEILFQNSRDFRLLLWNSLNMGRLLDMRIFIGYGNLNRKYSALQ